MWNKKISDMLSEFAEGVKNKIYKKIPYNTWRELRSHDEDYGTIEIKIAFPNLYGENGAVVFLKNQKGQELYSSRATDDSFGTYLFELRHEWRNEPLKKSVERMKESFNQLAATTTATTTNLTISSQALQDYSNTASGTGGIVQYGGASTGWSVYDNISPATVEVNSDYFKVNGQTIEEMVNEIVNKHNKKEEKKDMDLFKNFDFGSCENDKVKMSMYGVAVQNPTGTWVSYDPKGGNVIDVDILNFSGKYLYKMPVATKDIKVGDTIIHNRKPMFVTCVDGGKLLVIDPSAGEEKIVLPTKSMFGFDFVTRIVNLFGDIAAGATADTPFGNMLPLMMMSEGKNDDMLPLMFMMNGGKMDMNNPMMLYFLMKDGKGSDMLPLAFLASGNGIAFGKTCNCDCDKAN